MSTAAEVANSLIRALTNSISHMTKLKHADRIGHAIVDLNRDVMSRLGG